MHAVAPLIDKSSGESPLTVEYPGNGAEAIRVAIKRYNHAVTWATRHFISLISISKKYESNFKEVSKLHLLVVIYECTSGQSKRPCLKCITQLGDSLMFEQIDFSSSSSYSQFDVGSMFDYIRLHVARFVHCLSRQSLFFDIIPHYVQPPSL